MEAAGEGLKRSAFVGLKKAATTVERIAALDIRFSLRKQGTLRKLAAKVNHKLANSLNSELAS